MLKKVLVKVDRYPDKVRVQNDLGMDVTIQTNEADYVVSSLVGLTMAEFFKNSEYLMDEFQMTLLVEGLTVK